MADRVAVLTSALADRRLELEQATAKLAEHESLLERASRELATSNGDFEIWQAIDQRVRFETRQVERYRNTIEQCRQNVACASTAIEAAQREQRIEALQQSRSARHSTMSEVASNAAAHYRAAVESLRQLEPLQVEENEDLGQLQKLGETAAPIHALHSLWLALMNELPETIPANFGEVAQFEKKPFVENASRIFEISGPAWHGCPWPLYLAQTRAMLGDKTALQLQSLPQPKVEPPPEPAIQTESIRVSEAQCYFANHAYVVEEWSMPPDGKSEFRLVLTPVTGGRELLRRRVAIEHGLEADLVQFARGGSALVPVESKASIASAIAGVRDLGSDTVEELLLDLA